MKEKIKLFCLPYAGGSSTAIYKDWAPHLAENIELCPIELAGRGGRIAENYYTDLDAAVNDILNQIIGDISTHDYAVFGHSMGALLTYELIQKITLLGLRKPVHAFFSGRNPPGITRRKKPYTEMYPEEFEQAVLDLGGTPPEFFKYPELKEIFIPLLRSDFALSETKIQRDETFPLLNDISVLIGESEDIPPSIANKWKEHTDRKCDIHYIQGGHFFLLDQRKTVIDIVNLSLIQKNINIETEKINSIN